VRRMVHCIWVRARNVGGMIRLNGSSDKQKFRLLLDLGFECGCRTAALRFTTQEDDGLIAISLLLQKRELLKDVHLP